MACHIQGIRVAAPSSGQGTSRGTNYGLISSGHIFQIFQKIPGRLFQDFYPEVSVSPSHTASKYLMALRAKV